MSFLGKTRTLDASPPETRELRKDIAGGLQGQLPGAIGGAFGPMGDYSSNADMQFFLNNLMKPYQDLFTAQRGSALAQAKESAGNLTGSGYNNILGSAAGESIAQEQFVLANLLQGLRGQEMQRGLTLRGQDIGRQNDLLNMILGFSASGTPRQVAYQPGFLDYAAPVAGAAVGGYYGSK